LQLGCGVAIPEVDQRGEKLVERRLVQDSLPISTSQILLPKKCPDLTGERIKGDRWDCP
jgi:hypothetical protein